MYPHCSEALCQESDADAADADDVATRGAGEVRTLSRACGGRGGGGAISDARPPPTISLPRLLFGFDEKLPRFRPVVPVVSAPDGFPPGGPVVPTLLFTNIGGNRFLDGSFRTNPMPCTRTRKKNTHVGSRTTQQTKRQGDE